MRTERIPDESAEAAPAPSPERTTSTVRRSKLTVGASNDPLEHEADNVAHQVLQRLADFENLASASDGGYGEGGRVSRFAGTRKPTNEQEADQRVQRSPRAQATRPGAPAGYERSQRVRSFDRSTPFERTASEPRLQRSAVADHQDEALHSVVAPSPTSTTNRIQRKAVVGPEGGELDASSSQAIDRMRGGGSTLDPTVRGRLEFGFGRNLDHVRVHTGGESTELNESIQASAFTIGNDVFLHESAPGPSTPQGERLLAHEVAHTLQQGEGQRAGVAMPIRRDGDLTLVKPKPTKKKKTPRPPARPRPQQQQQLAPPAVAVPQQQQQQLAAPAVAVPQALTEDEQAAADLAELQALIDLDDPQAEAEFFAAHAEGDDGAEIEAQIEAEMEAERLELEQLEAQIAAGLSPQELAEINAQIGQEAAALDLASVPEQEQAALAELEGRCALLQLRRHLLQGAQELYATVDEEIVTIGANMTAVQEPNPVYAGIPKLVGGLGPDEVDVELVEVSAQLKATKAQLKSFKKRLRTGTKVTKSGDTTVTEQYGTYSETAESTVKGVTTKKKRAQAGQGVTSETASEVFDGTTTKKKSSKVAGFAGAEAAAIRISEASDERLYEALEVMARVGVFGEAEASRSIERGGLHASAEGSVKGSIGAEAYAKCSVEVKDIIEGIRILAEAGAKVGVEGSIAGQIAAGAGPLEIRLKGKLEGFAGAKAKAAGSFDLGLLRGLQAQGKVEAMAGATGTATGEVGIKVGDVDLSAELAATGFAGGEVSAEGKIGLSLAGVELAGKASAMAGVKTSLKATGSLKHNGRTLFKATGKVTAAAGAGGTVGGEFSFINGKLIIKGELAAVLGIGGGVELGIEVDFKEIASAIVTLVSEALERKKFEIDRKSPGLDRPVCLEPDVVRDKCYGAVIKDFQAYAAKKAKHGKHGVKQERVQEIIDKHHKGDLRDELQYVESDESIRDAILFAFPEVKDVFVQAGIIRFWDKR